MQVSSIYLLLLASTIVLLGHGERSKPVKPTKATVPIYWFGRQVYLRPKQSNIVYAVCEMEASSVLATDLPSVSGYMLFSQSYPHGRLQAYVNLEGFPLSAAKSLHGMHVHQYGVLNGSCPSTGPHYNPYGVNHPQRPGDFNNFQVQNGKIVKYMRNLRANLFGRDSILGRAVVLREKEDDLGVGGNQESLETGHSGRGLTCGTIAVSNGDLWKEAAPKM
ncbi:extracellular superoxide dismutase [Cu-Zn] [Amblyraja radiata]|uniref:extracellular superoxide dismutase [Cu-Zn] n=1 Tax=Amblyraja radiata TaxID=386614 RepID=UPI001401CBE3|nr:extracellular superoxide dismutase [Cu-Zn] [Amblyraja radiata]